VWRDVFDVLRQLRRDYATLKRDYRAAYPSLVSDDAWQRRFDGVSARPTR
jgi:hypothetical protein